MEPTKQDTDRLIELLSQAWDQEPSAPEMAEIEALVLKCGEAGGELLLNCSTLHLELHRHVAAGETHQRVMAAIASAANASAEQRGNELVASAAMAPVPADSGPPTAATAVRPPLLHSKAFQGIAVGALAASLLFSFGLHWYESQQRAHEVASGSNAANSSQLRVTKLMRPSMPVANLVSVNQAVWAEGTDFQVGHTLNENQSLELTSGSAQLSMACGADIVLQAPCSVTLVADDFAVLKFGKLTAQAAKWATGFAIESNGLVVTDLGTRFAVSADAEGVVEAHVLEGSVLAKPPRSTRPRQSAKMLESGQAIRVDEARSSVALMDARRDEFIDEFEEFRPLRPIDIWNTGVSGTAGSEDPRWRVTAGSKAFGPYPRQALVTAGDERSYEDNKPDVSQWISVSAEGYPGVPPESTHTFETTFDLTGYDLDTVYVVGYFLVDDAINELRINGHPVKFNRWVTTWDQFDFKSFHPIEIQDHFVPGENFISIDLYNSPSNPSTPEIPNPTALRVEWQAFGCTLNEPTAP